jgi:hypothetical protein
MIDRAIRAVPGPGGLLALVDEGAVALHRGLDAFIEVSRSLDASTMRSPAAARLLRANAFEAAVDVRRGNDLLTTAVDAVAFPESHALRSTLASSRTFADEIDAFAAGIRARVAPWRPPSNEQVRGRAAELQSSLARTGSNGTRTLLDELRSAVG